jgi:hypothetical protein
MSIAILHELVALTPAPPENADPDTLLAAFHAMYAARQAVLLTITKPFGESDEARQLVVELASRDAAWERALVASRDAIGAARANTSRLRGYAR